MGSLKLPGQREGETLHEAVNRLLDENDAKGLKIPHISQNGVEALYAFAYSFYQTGNYEKAMHFFRFLTMLDFHSRKHWMGLGASYQMLKQYERAIQCFGQAALMNEKDPYAHWHAAECFHALNNNEMHQQALKSAEIVAKQKPECYKSLLSNLALIKNSKPSK